MFAPPFSPYKFRHGFAVFGLKNSMNIAELKAISQNLMHSSIFITDSIYGILSDKDVIEEFKIISKHINSSNDVEENKIIDLLQEILRKFDK